MTRVTEQALIPALAFEPLSPVSFLDRTAAVFPQRIAVVDGDQRFTYAELHDRCRRLAGALAPLAEGRPVAVLAPNTHVMLEAHYAIPWAGAPLVTINTRLSAAEVRYILEHSESAVLLHDPQFDESSPRRSATWPTTRHRACRPGRRRGLRANCSPPPHRRSSHPSDERALLSINYTSGTTGRPKGVMYHHRGAYLRRSQWSRTPDDAPSASPVDPADVPLQRLVLPVGGHRCGGHARLLAQGRPVRGLATHP